MAGTTICPETADRFTVELYKHYDGSQGKPPSAFTVRIYLPLHVDNPNRPTIRKHVTLAGYTDVQGGAIWDLFTRDADVVRSEVAWAKTLGGVPVDAGAAAV